ncbi:MAG TPA: response regulator [Egicoccus sp.]|nr:response regulator [Egicoccus sp.]HSK24296.1 response regulator [Egicoccus sp.]
MSAPDATVLLVDDDDMVRLVTAMLLRRGGYEVVEAVNGHDAVARFEQDPDRFDAVLLDVMMPVMTGHEAFPRLRALDPELPIVFFSGFDQSEIAEHLSGATAHTAFLPKPYDNDALYAAMATAVRERSR